MGHRNTLSGHIQEPWYVKGTEREIRRLWEANERVIRSLPSEDSFPFLTRQMFFSSSMSLETTYRGSVICFGGSFSSIFRDWPEWLEKFVSPAR